jgi:hypothetical protein
MRSISVTNASCDRMPKHETPTHFRSQDDEPFLILEQLDSGFMAYVKRTSAFKPLARKGNESRMA